MKKPKPEPIKIDDQVCFVYDKHSRAGRVIAPFERDVDNFWVAMFEPGGTRAVVIDISHMEKIDAPK